MCGICGLIYRDPRQQPSADLLRRMTATLHHRGPDDSGIEIRGNVGLGHTRLSIIDLSAAGHQPMSNEDGTVWIVYNGEVYNFESLRRDLESRHQFRSHTDTEVLIHLYEERGERMVDSLDGMFAFAIVDLSRHRVLMARDPFGIKPLHYALDDRRLVFGSELKPLLASGEVARDVDTSALNDYIDFLWIPAPRTIFRGVSKLLPAHTLMLDLNTWEHQIRRYWRPQYRPEDGRTLESWADETESVLSAAVQRHMVADVPVGSFLSGGIDSSLVSLYAARTTNRPLRTFTVDFEDQSFSEAPYARQVAEKIHAEAVFRVLPGESVDQLSKLVEFYDEPLADASMLPTYSVSNEARKLVTVALSGDGGDELFSGYLHHRWASYFSRFDVVPRAISQTVFGAGAKLAPPKTRLHTLFRLLALPPDQRRLSMVRLPGRTLRAQVLNPEIREPGGERFWHMRSALGELRGLPPVTQVQFYDLLMYLPNAMLVKVDRASMAHALEVRVPLLCRDVADLAFRIPESIRFKAGHEKRVLRQLIGRHFGTELAERSKRGFGIPLARWMRDYLAAGGRQKVMNSRALQSGYLDRQGVQRLLDKVEYKVEQRLTSTRSDELFAMLMLVAWWDRYLA